MCDFTQNKHYYFMGDPQIIEGFKNAQNKTNQHNKTPLGKFIEYIGLPYVGDWLHDAKARFEYGVISRGYYDKISAEDNDVSEGKK
jgi:hypothetical protein